MAPSRSRSPLKKASILVRLLGTSVVAGAVVAGMALPAVGALGLGAKSAADSFNNLPSAFTAPPLAQASYIYDANGGLIAKVFAQDRDRTVVASNQIAPIVKSALVDIEDHSFYKHGAIDITGVLRALSKNASNGSVSQGASTLTQQYVKNVFVEEAGTDQAAVLAAQAQTVGRKIKELKYAIRVEETLTKDQILTNYLNITFFGESAYGIEAAAERYFSVHASQLTLPQAALLAGMVQSPSNYDPTVNPVLAKARRDHVLRDMAQYGTISQDVATQAEATPITLKVTQPRTGCTAARTGYGFFCDYVRQTMLDDPAFGKTAAERDALWHQGGLKIYTTIDPKAQSAVDAGIKAHVYASDEAATAMSIVQPGTGKILAMDQSRSYGLGTNQTVINYNAPSNLDGGMGFQTGSTFKPVIAAAALENGVSAGQAYNSPYSMPWPQMTSCTGTFPQGNGGEVKNDSTSLTGNFDMQTGMAQSVNTYFAQLEAQVGLCNVKKLAVKLGLSEQADSKTPLQVVPSMTLGTNTFTPLEMANVYATFAAHGLYCNTVAISSVVNSSGKSLSVPQANCQQVMSSTTANTVTTMLYGVVQDGTGKPAGLSDRPSAGKTGTTDGGADVWYVGFTPQVSAAVWVGDPASPNKSMNGVTIGGQYVSQAFGGTLAGPIWKAGVEGTLSGVAAENFTTVTLPSTTSNNGKTTSTTTGGTTGTTTTGTTGTTTAGTTTTGTTTTGVLGGIFSTTGGNGNSNGNGNGNGGGRG